MFGRTSSNEHDSEFGDELRDNNYLMKLAMSFAVAVTTESSSGWGGVALHGDRSLFNTLQRMLPQVCLRMVSGSTVRIDCISLS